MAKKMDYYFFKNSIKNIPVFLVSCIFGAFMFLYLSMISKDHMLEGGWTLLDESIVIGMFFSLLIIGIVFSDKKRFINED